MLWRCGVGEVVLKAVISPMNPARPHTQWAGPLTRYILGRLVDAAPLGEGRLMVIYSDVFRELARNQDVLTG
jgi:hypothetical protein